MYVGNSARMENIENQITSLSHGEYGGFFVHFIETQLNAIFHAMDSGIEKKIELQFTIVCLRVVYISLTVPVTIFAFVCTTQSTRHNYTNIYSINIYYRPIHCAQRTTHPSIHLVCNFQNKLIT